MKASLVALAGVAAVTEGFVRLSPSRCVLGDGSSSARAESDASCSSVGMKAAGRARRARSVSMMAVSTELGKETGESQQQNYDLQSWINGYESADGEDQYLMEASEGSIPKDIEGTFFRNGPGKFKIGDDLVMHPFDGDGMVSAISFSEEGAYFRNRYVKTTGFKKELAAGKQLYRGFGNLPGGPLKNAFRIKRKNLANTNVIYWGGKLLALWEGGLPYRLDPKSLDTLGETMLGETIDENRPTFSAHPRVDPKSERLIGFGSHNMQQTTIYEYDKDFKAVQSKLFKGVAGFLHDFAVTDTHYVFHSAPVGLNPLKWVLGLDTMGSALKWEGDTKTTNMLLVPRDPSKEMKTIPIPTGFCFHLANAYDDPKTGEVVVDLVESEYLALESDGDPSRPVWESVDFTKGVAKNAMKRYRLDVSSKEGSLVDCSPIYNQHLDFPTVNPRVSCHEHRYVWAACGSLESSEACPVQGVVKVDVVEGKNEKWIPEAHEFMGEPTFIPRKGAGADAPEDFGYIAGVLINGRDRRTEIVILDAADVAKGPLCRVPLKGFVPHTLHGEFCPELVLTPEQVEKSFALTDLFGKKGWNVAKSEFSGLGLNSMMD